MITELPKCENPQKGGRCAKCQSCKVLIDGGVAAVWVAEAFESHDVLAGPCSCGAWHELPCQYCGSTASGADGCGTHACPNRPHTDWVSPNYAFAKAYRSASVALGEATQSLDPVSVPGPTFYLCQWCDLCVGANDVLPGGWRYIPWPKSGSLTLKPACSECQRKYALS
jgi:hypothetical protein